MREKLKSFAKLAKIDLDAASYDAEIKEIPARLEAMETDMALLERLLNAERTQIEEGEQIRDMRVAEIAERSDALSKAKAKVARSQNLREADAAEREVAANRRAIALRKEQIDQIEETLGSKLETFEERKAQYEEARADFESEMAAAKARLEEVVSEREKIVVGRTELLAALPKSVLKRYERLRDHSKYASVVFVSDGTCDSCHQMLPPQLFIEVQRAEAFHNCPQCRAFLIYAGLLEEETPSAPAAESAVAG